MPLLSPICPFTSHQFLSLYGPYFLYVGSRKNYKGFSDLVHAVSLIVQDHTFSVVCVGSPFDKSELDLLESVGLITILYYCCR